MLVACWQLHCSSFSVSQRGKRLQKQFSIGASPFRVSMASFSSEICDKCQWVWLSLLSLHLYFFLPCHFINAGHKADPSVTFIKYIPGMDGVDLCCAGSCFKGFLPSYFTQLLHLCEMDNISPTSAIK